MKHYFCIASITLNIYNALLDFLDWTNPDIFKFISEDPNAKYVKHVDEYWLDQEVWHGVQTKQARGIDK